MSDKSVTVIDVIDDKSPLPSIPINPLDLPSEIFSSLLKRRLDNTKEIMAVIKSHLKSGVDYGSIPLKKGTAKTKPTLFKSGGEKIISLLGLKAHWPSYPKYEDAAINGLPIDIIIMRCELHDSFGRIVAEGIAGRYISTDYNDINKSLKMASKSSSLSAILSLGFSSMFTVDLEDLYSQKLAESSQSGSQVKKITQDQLDDLDSLVEKLNLEKSRVESYCVKLVSAKGLGVIDTLKDLPADLYDFVVNKLPDLAEKTKSLAEAA